MALLSNPIDKAAAELGKLRSARERLECQQTADRAKLTELRAAQGDAEVAELLGTRPSKEPHTLATLVGDARSIQFEIMEIEARIQGRSVATPKLLARIREALKVHARARAEVLLKQAAKLREKYDAHQAETARLLTALQAHAGCPYEMRLLLTPPPGSVFVPHALPQIVPKYRQMEVEINKLLNEAAAIEAQAEKQGQGGTVTGLSFDDIVKAIGDNPMAPTIAEVTAWHVEALERSRNEWEQGIGATINGARPPYDPDWFFSLTWSAEAVIDRQKSTCINRQNRRDYGQGPYPPRAVA